MSKPDRELLELAAKAAGIALEWSLDGQSAHSQCQVRGTWNYWNPLTDDGDALRLAVKLGISFDRTSNRCWAWVNGWHHDGVCEEFYGSDPAAATRRAIVRAAAEIGRAGDE